MKLKYKKIKFNRGMSLMEVVISSVIFLCLMGIASEIMYHSLKVSREENGLSFIRKEAVKGITWLSKDLRRTHGASLSDCNNPVTDIPKAMSFLTTIGNDVSGSQPNIHIASPQWEAYVIYYLQVDPKTPREVISTQPYYFLLKRAVSSPSKNSTFTTDPNYVSVFDPNEFAFEIPLAFNDVKHILDGTVPPDHPAHVVARNIYDVTIEAPGIEPSCCTVRIETRYKSPRGGELKSVETLTVFMRNTIMKIK